MHCIKSMSGNWPEHSASVTACWPRCRRCTLLQEITAYLGIFFAIKKKTKTKNTWYFFPGYMSILIWILGEIKREVLVKNVVRKILSLSACSHVKDVSGIKVKRGQLHLSGKQVCLLEQSRFLYHIYLSHMELPTLTRQVLKLNRQPHSLTSHMSYLTLA